MRTTLWLILGVALLLSGSLFGLVGCAGGPAADNVPRPQPKYNDQDDRDHNH